jgi:hypothetical protein
MIFILRGNRAHAERRVLIFAGQRSSRECAAPGFNRPSLNSRAGFGRAQGTDIRRIRESSATSEALRNAVRADEMQQTRTRRSTADYRPTFAAR